MTVTIGRRELLATLGGAAAAWPLAARAQQPAGKTTSVGILAIEKAHRGIYNIAEPSGYLSTEKAQRELGFDASVRLNAVA